MTEDVAADKPQTPTLPAKKRFLRRWHIALSLSGVAVIGAAALGGVDGFTLAALLLLPAWGGYLVARTKWGIIGKTASILLIAFVPLCLLAVGIYMVVLDARYPDVYEVRVDLDGIQRADIARIRALALEEAGRHSESEVRVDFENTSNSFIIRVSPERFAPLVELRLRRGLSGKVRGLPNGGVEIDIAQNGFREHFGLSEQIQTAFKKAGIKAEIEFPEDHRLMVRIDMGEQNFRGMFRPAGSDTRIAIYRADFDPRRVAEAIAYGAPSDHTLESIGSSRVLRRNSPSLLLGNAIEAVQTPNTSSSIVSDYAIRFHGPERSQLNGLVSGGEARLLVKCADHPFRIGQVWPNGLLAMSGPCLPVGSGPAFAPVAPVSIRKLR